MAPWFWYAAVAALLYGAHQIFTRSASDHIGDGLGERILISRDNHHPSLARTVCCLFAFACVIPLAAQQDDPRTAKGIQDNSFFIEEAYNQEAGVVQHILNGSYFLTRRNGPDDKELSFVFTQEWPVGSQTHQFSYTVPYGFLETGGLETSGIQDVLINYRLQMLTETAQRPAFAPRFSLIIPTGDEDEGFGSGTLGYQINLPVSKIVSDRWTLHANAGATLLPDVKGRDLANFNLGASAIFAVSRRLNLMLECVGFFDDEVADTGRRDRTSSVILSPGARYRLQFQKRCANGRRPCCACRADFSRARFWRFPLLLI